MLACGNVSSFLLEYLFASCRCLARSSVTLKALDGFVLCFSSRGSFLLLLGCFLLLPFRLRDLLDALKSLHFIELTSDHFDFNKIRVSKIDQQQDIFNNVKNPLVHLIAQLVSVNSVLEFTILNKVFVKSRRYRA